MVRNKSASEINGFAKSVTRLSENVKFDLGVGSTSLVDLNKLALGDL